LKIKCHITSTGDEGLYVKRDQDKQVANATAQAKEQVKMKNKTKTVN
jgi:hypothetical protein